MSEWQNIETAPKDGSWILVTYPHFNRNNMSNAPDEYSILMVHWKGVGWDTGGWMLHSRPHHWFPLPELPPIKESE